MNRALTWINLAGVVALAVLCTLQWRTNRALNLDINTLQQTGQTQAARLAEQDKNLAGLAADLESFRNQITRAHAELRETAGKLHSSEAAVAQLTADRDQLQEGVVRWTAAVQARDERIAEANHRIQEVGDRLKEAVEKFNDLAARYNERTQQLNDLTTRYNETVELLNQARGVKPADAAASAKAS